MTEHTPIATALRGEANASEELNPEDSDVAVMREAATLIEALVEALTGYKKLTRSAQDILTTYLTPDGYDADAAVGLLLALLDGPCQREVEGKARAVLSQVKT